MAAKQHDYSPTSSFLLSLLKIQILVTELTLTVTVTLVMKEDEINVPMMLSVFRDKGSRRWSNGMV